MYNRKDILKSLNEFNYFIDESVLDTFIKNWKIDAIYEDEDGVEFFDNLSIIKIKKGISLKSQGYDTDQIVYHLNKLMEENKKKEEKKAKASPVINSELGAVEGAIGMQNVTLDITSQTLQMLAEAVAQKITTEIKDQLLLDDKKGKEELVQKVDELTADNKKLAKRIEELEHSKKYCPINFEYFKKFLK